MGMLQPGGAEALVLAAIVLLFFFLLGLRELPAARTGEQFFFAGRSARVGQLSNAWAATTVSFAVGLFYYMQVSYQYGAWIFLISIATYLAGNLLFIHVARKTNELGNFQSLGHLVRRGSGSITLGTLVNLGGLVSLVSLIFLELVLGAALIGSLFKGAPATAEPIFFFVMLGIVGSYVMLGGMRAVLASDRWQLWMVRLSILALGAIGIATALMAQANGMWRLRLEPNLPFFDEALTQTDILSFVLFGIVVNSLTLFTQGSSWQLLASTEPKHRARALLGGVIQAFSIFTISISVAFAFRSSGLTIASPADVFAPATALGEVGTHFLIPIMFAGFLAAMVSTADTALLGAVLTISRLVPRELESDGPNAMTKRGIVVAMVLLGVTALYLWWRYYLPTGFIGMFLGLTFYLFSHAVVFVPLIIASAIAPARIRDTKVVLPGLAACWLAQTAAAGASIATGDLKIQFYASVVTLSLAYLLTIKKATKPRIQTEGQAT